MVPEMAGSSTAMTRGEQIAALPNKIVMPGLDPGISRIPRSV